MEKSRKGASGWWVVLLTATLAVPALGDSVVRFYEALFSQVITSSTLKWSPFQKEFMSNYVIGAESSKDPIYICQAQSEGDMQLGQLRPDYSSCAVPGAKSYSAFEVLENIENASLIIWQPWDKFQSKPDGGVVVSGGAFIGRKKSNKDFSYNIGRIQYESAVGDLFLFDENNEDHIERDGEILVEVAPVYYELKDVVLELNTEHVRYNDPQVIGERILRNDADVAMTVNTVIEHKFSYTLSWGHGHGIAIGLNTTITMANGTEYPPIAWSTPYNVEKKELYTLEKHLEPGTACNVTLIGKDATRDVRYNGRVTTFFRDHESRTRKMRGERIESTTEVQAIYGDVYFVGNNSLVPTTTTTTTTTTTSTTTTSTTTPPPVPQTQEDNEITKSEPNDMQNDSSEAKPPPPGEQKIAKAVVAGIGSGNSGAYRDILSFTMLIPALALLL